MGSKENKKRGEEPEPTRWSNEIIGIVLIAAGVVLLLSLVSYTPADLPKKGFFDSYSGKNLIGPLGGFIGFTQIALLGAASYLLPVGLIWFGVAKMGLERRLWPKPVVGFLVLLVSAATFLAAAGVFFDEWALRCHLSGPGGVIGKWIGGNGPQGEPVGFLSLVVARTGALLVSGTAYLVALLLLTGQHPIRFIKACYVLGRRRWEERKIRRSEEGKVSAREAEMLAERERQREQRRKDREAAKLAAEAAMPEPDPQASLGLRETPAPQIIDASQRRNAEPVVPGTKPFERRKPAGHQFLSVNEFEDYELPGFDLLDAIEEEEETRDDSREEMLATQRTIVETLKAFAIDVSPGDITRGPTITRYEIYPSTGLRVSRISQLEADIARATRAERINILAPIPGKDTVGIELANSQKVAVPLHELLHDPEFRSAKKKIPLALGKDVYGKTVIGDLAAMPHLLVAGATGSGKSVCINSIIASMLFKFGPDELRFIMVDPKVVEMQMYNKLPHLICPVVTDPKKTVAALKWVVNEMEKRYRIFAKEGVRNFDSFNNRPRPDKAAEPEAVEPEPEEPTLTDEELDAIVESLGEGDLAPEAEDHELDLAEEQIPDRFPYIVVLIDELADLMQTAPADVEMCIARIAQKARAAGIHLIIATQTPRADVVTGIIKANIPCRIAFQVSSALDSRVILDTKGADKLVGKGDMLFLPPGSAKLERSQGAFVSDAEVERIVDHCAAQGSPKFETDIQASINSADDDEEEDVSDADEELIMKCIEVVRSEKKASTSLLQRRLRLGYTRAARMVDILEQRGVVGPGEGAKPREVYLK